MLLYYSYTWLPLKSNFIASFQQNNTMNTQQQQFYLSDYVLLTSISQTSCYQCYNDQIIVLFVSWLLFNINFIAKFQQNSTNYRFALRRAVADNIITASEYCTVAWSPHYKKEKYLLERMQHRFTRMIPDMK